MEDRLLATICRRASDSSARDCLQSIRRKRAKVMARARPRVDQDIKYKCQDSLARPGGKLGSEDHDAVSRSGLRVTLWICECPVMRVPGRTGTGDANLERAAHNSSYLDPNSFNDQSLVDHQRVESARNEARQMAPWQPPPCQYVLGRDRTALQS